MHLERWMIDEIIDDDIRVLRAGLRDESATAAVEAAMSIRGRAAPGRRRPRATVEAVAIRKVVVDLEAAPVAIWTPDAEVMADRVRLHAFLVGGARRTARPGLPARDQLREGDVYWVIYQATDDQSVRPVGQDLASDETAALLDRLQEAGAEVWDVTAASRQVMKRLYTEAAFARDDERSTSEGRGDG